MDDAREMAQSLAIKALVKLDTVLDQGSDAEVVKAAAIILEAAGLISAGVIED